MAANIETHSNEKELSSPQSSVNQQNRLGAAHLDERRRAALAQIDNATFSLVLLLFVYLFLVLTSHLTVGSMSKSSCRWRWLLCRCVSGALGSLSYRPLKSETFLDTTFLPSTSRPDVGIRLHEVTCPQHEPRSWRQGCNSHRYPLWATTLWLARRRRWTEAHVYVFLLLAF
jgi:hypothetical protein